MLTWYRLKNGIIRRIYFLHRFQFRKLGKHSVVFKPICLIGKKYISLGNNVRFGEYSRIEAIDSRNKKKFTPSLTVGDNTSFEQFAHIIFSGSIVIGKGCTFSCRVMITTANHIYNEKLQSILFNDLASKDIKIGDYCFFGMDTKIFPGVSVGDHVIVGANSIIMHDLPSYTICVGVPAKPIKKYNENTGRWEKI